MSSMRILTGLSQKALDESDKLIGKTVLAVSDTIKESETEIKIALVGGLMMGASSFLDLDCIGVDPETFDATVGRVGKVLVEGAALSGGYKLAKNLSRRLKEDSDEETIIKELNLDKYLDTEITANDSEAELVL